MPRSVEIKPDPSGRRRGYSKQKAMKRRGATAQNITGCDLLTKKSTTQNGQNTSGQRRESSHACGEDVALRSVEIVEEGVVEGQLGHGLVFGRLLVDGSRDVRRRVRVQLGGCHLLLLCLGIRL